MSDTDGFSIIDDNNSILYDILKICANNQTNLSIRNINNVNDLNCFDYYKMLSTTNSSYSTSSNISCSNFASESFADIIIEENGRISLAYENLQFFPETRIAEKFSAHTNFLDLSYNNFQALSFLSLFEELHTLILDRNTRLDANTLPFLGNLKILWLNNCEIANIAEWVHEIEKQCPALEHLSLMGNPGISSVFYCTLSRDAMLDPTLHNPIVTDYRDYILNSLPNLNFLDGIPRNVLSQLTQNLQHQEIASTSSTKYFSTPDDTNNIAVGHSNRLKYRKTLPTPKISFKDLFSLKRRKKSYQSSSTN